MKLQSVGFFRELKHGDCDGPSLRECRRDVGDEYEARLVDYLNQGQAIVVCAGTVGDALDEADPFTIAPNVLTDGVWAWSADLAHYVNKYHAKLPESFIEHLRSRDFKPPNESEVDVRSACRTRRSI